MVDLVLKQTKEGAKKGQVEAVLAYMDDGGHVLSPTNLLRLCTNDYHSIKKAQGHVELAKQLTERGAEVDQEVIYQVSRTGHLELMEAVTSARVEYDVFHAASRGDASALESQLKSNPELPTRSVSSRMRHLA